MPLAGCLSQCPLAGGTGPGSACGRRWRPGAGGAPGGTHRELAHLPAVHPLVLRLGRDGVGQFLEEKGLPWVPAQHSGQARGARHAP